MALFRDSTQAAEWTLDSSTLEARRKKVYETAMKSRRTDTNDVMLTMVEEARIRAFHERRILRFVNQIRFPQKVAATAITYFKRYFLDRSILDYNPSVIALSSLYAAFKVEEVLLSADDLVSRTDVILNGVAADMDLSEIPDSVDGTSSRVSSDILLKTELSFLQQLRFHLICYHPFRSLGILREQLFAADILCEKGEDADSKDDSKLANVLSRAEYIVTRRALPSDLLLCHTPAILAIAATLVAIVEAFPESPDIQMNVLKTIGISEEISDRVTTVKDQLMKLPDKPKEGEAEIVAALEKKRRALQKDENDPTTKEYQENERMKLDEEEEEELDRNRIYQKRLKEKTAQLLGFGSEDPNHEDEDEISFVKENKVKDSKRQRKDDSESRRASKKLRHDPEVIEL